MQHIQLVVEDELHYQVKLQAVKDKISISALIRGLLEKWLKERKEKENDSS